jgi:hypothetical protein
VHQIKLHNGLLALVDADDFDRLSRFSWRATKSKTGHEKWYAVRGGLKGEPSNVFMHRVIMDITHPDVHVDHKNGNGLDNTRGNLRFCIESLNSANARLPLGPSGLRGVYVRKDTGRYRASISVTNRTLCLGTYADAHTAALAYDNCARLIFGEFATLNFPDEHMDVGRRQLDRCLARIERTSGVKIDLDLFGRLSTLLAGAA